ncbi:hypothetical protein ACFL21_05335 [Patescibacteria group bacterium]
MLNQPLASLEADDSYESSENQEAPVDVNKIQDLINSNSDVKIKTNEGADVNGKIIDVRPNNTVVLSWNDSQTGELRYKIEQAGTFLGWQTERLSPYDSAKIDELIHSRADVRIVRSDGSVISGKAQWIAPNGRVTVGFYDGGDYKTKNVKPSEFLKWQDQPEAVNRPIQMNILQLQGQKVTLGENLRSPYFLLAQGAVINVIGPMDNPNYVNVEIMREGRNSDFLAMPADTMISINITA